MNPILFLSTQPLVEPLAWALLHFIWQGAAIAIVYQLMRRFLLQRSTSSFRYVAGCLALGMMTLTVLVTFALMRAAPVPLISPPHVVNSGAAFSDCGRSGLDRLGTLRHRRYCRFLSNAAAGIADATDTA